MDSNYFYAAEYTGDIYKTLKSQEYDELLDYRRVESQPEIEEDMRKTLLEFMVEVRGVFDLGLETFSLAVSILDRYSSRRIIYARHYQLVGCVSLWIAAKHMDLKNLVPTVQEMMYVCADNFSRSMFHEMELHILSALDWRVGWPTAIDFVDVHIAEMAPLQNRDLYSGMAKYICNCALFELHLINFLPSTVAATSMELAVVIIDSLCGINRRFEPVSGSDPTCFELLAGVIASPPLVINDLPIKDIYNLASLVAQFVHHSRKEPEPSTPINECFSPQFGLGASPQSVGSSVGMPHTPDAYAYTPPRQSLPFEFGSKGMSIYDGSLENTHA